MTLPIYPDKTLIKGLGYSTKWSPDFFNMKTQTTASGADIDLRLSQYPIHNFELTYNFLRDWLAPYPAGLEFRTLAGFWLQLGGTSGRFLFKWPDDCQVRQQSIGTGDGATTVFTVQRFFGANSYGLLEPVGAVDQTQPFAVYLGGSASPLPPADYTLNTGNPMAQTIAFAAAPAPGANIAVNMNYYYYCKFADNDLTFEKFMSRLWQLQKVSIKSCRAGT